MQRLVNGSWEDCQESDLSINDTYRVSVGGGGWHAQKHNPISKSESERIWRDSQLLSTDWIVLIPDHPELDKYMLYRQALRDYPNNEDFPDGTRPSL